MTTASEVTALVRAHADRDDAKFRAITLAIAANAEAKSPTTAKALRALADRTAQPMQLTALPDSVPIVATHPRIELDTMVLEPSVRQRLDRVLAEQAARDRLFLHGLAPMRKLLFVGPPGTGKTMAAAMLATALQLPLMSVQLHGVLGKHLGETSRALGQIFETAKRMRGVYFFDEFDGMASSRDTSNEVGEMRRVVSSLLGFIENDDSNSLIVAATNHVGAIDSAMFRRFEDIITFPLPTAEVAARLLRAQLGAAECRVDWSEVERHVAGMGHADLVGACQQVRKDAVLEDRDVLSTSDVIAELQQRKRRA